MCARALARFENGQFLVVLLNVLFISFFFLLLFLLFCFVHGAEESTQLHYDLVISGTKEVGRCFFSFCCKKQNATIFLLRFKIFK